MPEQDVYHRLFDHFMVLARDALDDEATEEEIIFEARVLYGRFFGWTVPSNGTVH